MKPPELTGAFGVAMATAIISVLTGIPVRKDVAMTGEITLRGRVLPIGGLKEKLLAALRGGIKTVLIPEENRKDLAHRPPGQPKKRARKKPARLKSWESSSPALQTSSPVAPKEYNFPSWIVGVARGPSPPSFSLKRAGYS